MRYKQRLVTSGGVWLRFHQLVRQRFGAVPDVANSVFNFHQCQGRTSIDEFGRGLGQSQALLSATIIFRECEGLISIDEFVKGSG